jgi:hypothetical protein
MLKYLVQIREKIIDTSTKGTREKIINYFNGYRNCGGILPRTVVACPGGLSRSLIFPAFLERNKLAICPWNIIIGEDNKEFYKGIKFFNDLDLVIKEHKDEVDLVVLCSDLISDFDMEKIKTAKEVVPKKTPVLLLKGMEGHFLNLCNSETTL